MMNCDPKNNAMIVEYLRAQGEVRQRQLQTLTQYARMGIYFPLSNDSESDLLSVSQPSPPTMPGISVRLTLAEDQIINDAVTRSGTKNKSEWARKALIHVAENDIRIT